MSAVERQLTKQLIEERQARQKAIEDMRAEFMAMFQEVHAKIDEPLLANLEAQRASTASAVKVEQAQAVKRQEVDDLLQRLAGLEKSAVRESAVSKMLTERLKPMRQEQHQSLTEGLELIRSTQNMQMEALEAGQVRLRNGLDELANIMVGAPKLNIGVDCAEAAQPMSSGEETELLRRLQAQLKDLEETHSRMAKHGVQPLPPPPLDSQPPRGGEARKNDARSARDEEPAREISNMVSQLVTVLQADVEKQRQSLEAQAQLVGNHDQQIKDLDNAVFDLRGAQTLTAMRATKLALRSPELSEENRMQALASLEAREKEVKENIDKMTTQRETLGLAVSGLKKDSGGPPGPTINGRSDSRAAEAMPGPWELSMD